MQCMYVCSSMVVLAWLALPHSQRPPFQANATTNTSACQRYNYTEVNGTDTVDMYPPRICHVKSTGVRSLLVGLLCAVGTM